MHEPEAQVIIGPKLSMPGAVSSPQVSESCQGLPLSEHDPDARLRLARQPTHSKESRTSA